MQKRVKENKMIFGLHSIIEAIEAGKDIEKIYIKRDFGGELAKTASPAKRYHKRS